MPGYLQLLCGFSINLIHHISLFKYTYSLRPSCMHAIALETYQLSTDGPGTIEIVDLATLKQRIKICYLLKGVLCHLHQLACKCDVSNTTNILPINPRTIKGTHYYVVTLHMHCVHDSDTDRLWVHQLSHSTALELDRSRLGPNAAGRWDYSYTGLFLNIPFQRPRIGLGNFLLPLCWPFLLYHSLGLQMIFRTRPSSVLHQLYGQCRISSMDFFLYDG